MITTKSENFFKSIFNEETINFRCLKESQKPININGYYNENTKNILQQANEQGFEIYFVVNSGGYKDKDITTFNAVYIDLDCGRDENNEYYPLDIVSQYKANKLNELDKFVCQPTFIVETRNGMHCYWLLKSNPSQVEFVNCEELLIRYFEADTKVKNPARLMRVPGYFWLKDSNNPFLSNVIQSNENKFYIDDIIGNLPKAEEFMQDYTTYNKKKYNTLLLIEGTKSIQSPTTNNLTYIVNKDIDKLQQRINPVPIEFSNHDQVYDYLKKQDLKLFLGLSNANFKCIFHDDHKPSAGIIINSETEHNIYNCLSSNCGFKGTIIQCTEKILHCNRVNALRFLRKVYQVDYVETNWQKEQREIIDENQRFIFSNELELFYPELNKRIRHYITDLNTMLEVAKQNILTETFSKDDLPVFFISIRRLSQLCGKDTKTISKRINLLAYLGLINKLPNEAIPPHFLKRAKHEAIKKKQNHLITFYSIPSYCYSTLSYSERKAIDFKTMEYTIAGWSRELILRSEGEEEANRVFPQMANKPIPTLNQIVSKEILFYALDIIEEQGYATEDDILKNISFEFKGKEAFLKKQIKRTLFELFSKNNIKRIRLTKMLKEQLGITCKGYPYIFMK